MTTTYAGLDYSLGKANYHLETGIHFGVISQNSIDLDMSSDWEYEYAGPNCPDCSRAVKSTDDETALFADYEGELDDDGTPSWYDGKDYACLDCKQCLWSDAVWSEESTGWHYDSDGYKLMGCLDNDIVVLESPYFTWAQFCSPCVPGAGNLDSPMAELETGVKTYCLGPEYFGEYNPMPYRAFRVSDNTEVSK